MRSPGLPRNSRPFAVAELTSEQLRLVAPICAALTAMWHDALREAPLPEQETLWAVPNPGHSHRVIMIDGARGTGKTSFMLTLIQLWRAKTSPVIPEHLDVTDALAELRGRVHVLPALDFDPLPAHIHAYSWIVSAFEPLVLAIAKHYGEQPNSNAPGRSLYALWQSIHKHALLGWSAEDDTPPTTRDADELAYMQATRERSWNRIRPAWREFANHLLATLEHLRSIAQGALILLPIDDIDLHPQRAKELLLALRLCNHPRICFFVAGSVRHLQETLAISYFERELQSVNPESLPETQAQSRWLRASRLAEDLTRKVLPDSLRFSIPLLEYTEALPRLKEIVSLPADLETILSTTKLLLEEVRSGLGAPHNSGFRLRDLESIAGLLAEGRDPTKQAAILFGTLVLADDSHMFAQRHGWPLTLSPPVHLRPHSMGSGGTRSGNKGLHFTSSVRILARVEGATRSSACDPHIFAASIAGAIAGDSLNWTEGAFSFLVESELVLANDLSVRLRWPLAFPSRSPRAFVERLRTWRGLRQEFSSPDPDSAAIIWAVLAITESLILPWDEAPKKAREFLASPDPWQSVYTFVFRTTKPISSSQEPALRDWLYYRLPLLSAPEYGLTGRAQAQLIAAVLAHWGERPAGTLYSAWHGVREQAIADFLERDPGAPKKISSKDLLTAFGEEPGPALWRTPESREDQWWRLPMDPMKDAFSFGDARVGPLLRMRDLLSDPRGYGIPWHTRHIGRKLDKGTLSRFFERVTDLGLDPDAQGSAAYVAILWRCIAEKVLVEEKCSDEILQWLDTSSDALDLVYTGPGVEISPHGGSHVQIGSLTLHDYKGWRIDFLGMSLRAENAAALGSILFLAQASTEQRSRVLSASIDLRIPDLLTKSSGERLGETVHLPRYTDWEFARLAWREILRRLRNHLSMGREQAVEAWAFAQWLWIVGWGMEGRPAAIDKLRYPITSQDLVELLNAYRSDAPFRRWLDKLVVPPSLAPYLPS